MKAVIAELRALGYDVARDGQRVRLRFAGEGEPPADRVRPLLDRLRADKAGALAALVAETIPSREEEISRESRRGTATLQRSAESADSALENAPPTVAAGVATTVAVQRPGAGGPAAMPEEPLQTPDTATVTATVAATLFGPDSSVETAPEEQPLQCCTVAAPSDDEYSPALVELTLRLLDARDRGDLAGRSIIGTDYAVARARAVKAGMYEPWGEGEPATGAWYDWPPHHGLLTEPEYQAVVDADLARYGVSTPRREYAAMAADPRPDLADDSDLWRELLLAAFRLDGAYADGVFAALHGLRCEGAGLELGPQGARIVPGEIAGDLYHDWRCRWLLPHRSALVALLDAKCPAPAPAVAFLQRKARVAESRLLAAGRAPAGHGAVGRPFSFGVADFAMHFAKFGQG